MKLNLNGTWGKQRHRSRPFTVHQFLATAAIAQHLIQIWQLATDCINNVSSIWGVSWYVPQPHLSAPFVSYPFLVASVETRLNLSLWAYMTRLGVKYLCSAEWNNMSDCVFCFWYISKSFLKTIEYLTPAVVMLFLLLHVSRYWRRGDVLHVVCSLILSLWLCSDYRTTPPG